MNRRQFLDFCAMLSVTALHLPRTDKPRKRVVIAGGGIIGASIAYHLAKRGAQVTLLEKLGPASGATGNSFAWLNSTFSKQPRAYFDLNHLGMAGWQHLDHEFNGALKVQWGGSVEWYPTGKDADQLRVSVRSHQQWGYNTRLIEAAELQRLLPNVTTGEMSTASFSEAEGTVDPAHVVNVLLQKAQKLGARILHPCELIGLDLNNGQVRGAQTSKGRIDADAVVLAAGTETQRLAAMANIKLPLKDSPGVLVHTRPQRELLTRVALAPGAHIKQSFDGRIITGSDFGGTPITDTNPETARRLLNEAVRFLPQLKNAAIERVTLGWRVLPQDEFPVVGFADQCANLYLAAMHSGVTLAPLVGRVAAAEILDGVGVEMLQPYRPARFN